LQDKHVRVDVFYDLWAPKRKAWINLVGHIFLLVPWSILIIVTGYNYTLNSWAIREGSAEPGGLPARYLIKGAIVVGFVLLLLQALSQIIKDLQLIINNKE
jgi:TRAP-type mannitol/chloroaromatic compound transport system permease small subunit